VTSTVLSYYEKDKRGPTALTIARLADALDITGDALLGREHPDLVAHNKSEFLVLNSMRDLDRCGQEKVMEYISDMLATGKHAVKK